VLQIGWQERVTIHYKVVPLNDESKTCLLSECSFSEMAQSSTADCVLSEATDYLCLERARDSFEVSIPFDRSELAHNIILPINFVGCLEVSSICSRKSREFSRRRTTAS
jgi:hypothetical protein